MKKKRFPGFTLIELIVTMAIIGILISIVFGVTRIANVKSAESKAQSQLQVIANALEEYRLKYGEYPEPDEFSDIYELFPELDLAQTDPWDRSFIYEPERMNPNSPYLTYTLRSEGLTTNSHDDIFSSREGF